MTRPFHKIPILLALFAIAGLCANDALAAKFERVNLPVERGRLYDIGVTDHDGDGRLDVFTANHKFLGSLLERSGAGWRDVLGESGLSATPEFPGWEDLLHPPKIDAPGLYFYVESRTDPDGKSSNVEEDPRFHVVARNTGSIPGLDEPARGKITLLSPDIRVKRSDGGIIHVARDETADPPRTVISFRTGENAHLVFTAKKVDLPPIEVEISQAPARARTFVGADKVPAPSRSFRLFLRDRHGFAWGDYNSDGRIDTAIVRGGLGGAIASFNGILDDELMIAGPGGVFLNRIDGSRINKGRCRGRHTEAVDFNRDGRLDLFISCKEGPPKLYQGFGNGRFQGVSRQLRRLGVGGTAFRWVQVDGRGGEELLAASKRRVRTYSFRKGRFRKGQVIETRNSTSKVDSLISGDIDGDGDADALIATPSRNTVLLNRGGKLRAVSPFAIGLPGRSYTAALVDFDNDGRTDIHFLPQGLYRQKAGGNFRATGRERSADNAVWGLLSWFDYDNDGDRDYIRALNRNHRVNVQTGLFRNSSKRRNHWLQIDLVGKGGNRQGIGARVVVTAAGRKQTQWIGDADSSRFSRGHYRLYFGTRNAERVKKIKVHWPLGSKTVLRGVAADQRLVIRR